MRLVPFLAETTTHKCAPRRANKQRLETETRGENSDHAGPAGIQLQRNAARWQAGKVAGRRQPPASSVEKYLGHLLSYLDSLGLAWLGFLALLLLLLPGNVALTVRHETCLYLSISPTSIAASVPHFCISPTATATPSPSSSAGRVLTN